MEASLEDIIPDTEESWSALSLPGILYGQAASDTG